MSGSSKSEQGPEPLYPQLRARRNVPREAVSAHQRTRLHGAMIEAVVAHGYDSITVNEVARLAGVSKKTVYKHFESKDDCLFRTHDLVVREAAERIAAAYRSGPRSNGEWAAGLRRAFEAFAAELVDRPKPSRLALVGMWAAGPEALRRLEGTEAALAKAIGAGLAGAPGGADLPPSLLRALAGGCLFSARNRLLDDDPEATARCAGELLDWVSSCAVSAAALPPPGLGGQAPSPNGSSDPAARAPGDPGESFTAALERQGALALARMLRESEGAPDWPAAVFRATHALFREIAECPELARPAFVEAFAAGAAGTATLTELMRSFAALLVRRAPREVRPSPAVAEAMVGAVWTLARRHVAAGRARALPSLTGQATYLILPPSATGEAHAAIPTAQETDSVPAREVLAV